jgi:2'-5' RNA ligase
VDASLRGDIQGACATVAGVFPPVLLYFAGFGAFPSPARARVVWVGVLDPSSAVATLASALDGALVGLGLQAETKPYRAHVTLARLGSPKRLEVDLSPPPATEEFEMSSITLFRSHVSNRGARYESLGRYELLG